MRKADLIGGIGFVIFALLMILRIIPGETESGTTYGLSPYFYPTVMSAGILICGIGLVWQNWRQPRPHNNGDQAVNEAGHEIEIDTDMETNPEAAPLTASQLMMFLIAMAVIVTSVWLIQRFGIVVFAPVLIAALMIFLGERDWRVILPTMLLPVGIVYLIVTHVLQSPLP
ncbi:MAG: tripartite tricarboxylate transporter TctB family protein [Burkholderiaceae bacterium]